MCKLLYKQPIPMSCLLHGERTKEVVSEGTYSQLPPAVAQVPTDMFIPGQSSLVFCFS